MPSEHPRVAVAPGADGVGGERHGAGATRAHGGEQLVRLVRGGALANNGHVLARRGQERRGIGGPAELFERDDELDRRQPHAAVLDGHGQRRPVELHQRLPEALGVVVAVDHGSHERGRALALDDVADDALQLELLLLQLEVQMVSLQSSLAGQQVVEHGPQLGRRESPVLGGQGEVERGQDRALEMHVQDALGVLDSMLWQLGDPVGAGQGLVEHLVVGADVVGEADLRSSACRDPVAGERVLLGELQAGEEGPGHRTAVGGDQADRHMGIGEVGALGHVDDV